MKIYERMPGIGTRRRALEMKVADAAAALGVTPQTWYDWEKGKYVPSGAVLPAIAELLRCEIVDLYEDGGTRSFADAQDDSEKGGEEAGNDDTAP